ncbi:hypothetical protein HNQ07_002102 [Deinococcus metalli]|uniref:O-antigen polymerase n=1 Tax=Deinococcus metalli TaxID=1141878 RepID=A0A7W8NR89_9DEIO|nr:O-antigen ligase family protein [Deinococcus metalli]MBB5376638.1 hypothetical protein [Deinococcus metalli]GHF42597.1 O-antigen polymerase [Deinococcus metalli]
MTAEARPARTDLVVMYGLVIMQVLFYFDASALLPFMNDGVKNAVSIVLLAVVAVLSLLRAQSGSPLRFDLRLLPVLGFVLAYVVALVFTPYTDLPQFYAGKISKLLLISVPSILALNYVRWTPALAGRTFGFFNAMLLVVLADGSYQLLRGASYVSRDESFGIDPISLGRAAGFCTLYALVKMATTSDMRRRHAAMYVPALMFCGSVMFASGSRGPLIALAVAFFSSAVLIRTVRYRLRVLSFAALALLLGVVGVSYLLQNDVASTGRVLSFLQGDLNVDRSAEIRSQMYLDVLQAIPQHLLGLGQAASQVYTAYDLKYPHNLFLEVQLEGGVAVTALLVLAIAVAYRTSRRAVGGTQVLVPVTLTYFLVNSQFSGDISSNRFVLLMLAIAAVSHAAPAMRGALSKEAI